MVYVKQETKVFQCLGIQSDIERMVNEINAYVKDTGAEISYHNVPSENKTLVIATVKLLGAG
jgi:hypothetical protein